jgi:hypothetical protein
MIVRILVGLSFALLSIVMVATGTANAALVDGPGADDQIKDWTVMAETAPNCRYGVFADAEELLTQLRFGWVLDFTASPRFEVPETIEYAHMIRLRQVKSADGVRQPAYNTFPGTDQIAKLVEKNPGRLWIIGNEPDRLKAQDDVEPKMYAVAYHDLYYLIKDIDPTAQVAVAGLVGVTPGRLQYLDIMWDEYYSRYGDLMPVDVWNFHNYIMAEVQFGDITLDSHASVAIGTDRNLAKLDSGFVAGNPDSSLCPRDDVVCVAEHDDVTIFAQMVLDMRRWMRDHGQQQKPLILTEFGPLFPYAVFNGDCGLKDENGECFTPQRAAEFMQKTYEYLENTKDPDLGYALDDNRLVQQWLWFSMPYADANPNTNAGLLATQDLSALTTVGQMHLAEINKRPLYNNLLVERVNTSTIFPSSGDDTATLSVVLRSSGNTTINQPITVSFYADEARTQQIGTATIPAGMRGCGRVPYTAELTWRTPPPPGAYPFWVTVDPGNEIVETTTSDNQGQGFLFVVAGTDRLFLPTIQD